MQKRICVISNQEVINEESLISNCREQIVKKRSLKFFTKHYGVSSGLLLYDKKHFEQTNINKKKEKDTIVWVSFCVLSIDSTGAVENLSTIF